jgi:hypothetical protein
MIRKFSSMDNCNIKNNQDYIKVKTENNMSQVFFNFILVIFILNSLMILFGKKKSAFLRLHILAICISNKEVFPGS